MLAVCASLLLSAGPLFAQSPAIAPPSKTAHIKNSDDPVVALGSYLFRSPLLSEDSTVSCATCHPPSLNYSGDRAIAVGVGGHLSGRRAPSLLGLRNLAPLRWDGRAANLAVQVGLPLESPEMAVNWPAALARLSNNPEISELIGAVGLHRLNREAVLAALTAYVASLEPGPSRFDRFYYGHQETALTPQEAWGLRLFTHRARCGTCHLVDGRAAPFTDGSFHVTGIGYRHGRFIDRGRAGVTNKPGDEGAFKTPGLRGVALRPYLMHDGSVKSLEVAVEHYNRIGKERVPNLDERLKPLFLSRDEVDAIVAFLRALTPEERSGK